jgi:hypothetical protein
MLNSAVLEVVIGMIFIFLLLSLIASVVQELLSSFMQLRAANLLRGVRSLFSGEKFDGKDLVDSIYTHGLVRGLFSDPKLDQGVQAKAGAEPGAETFDWLRYKMRTWIGIKPASPVAGVSNQLKLPSYIPSRTFALALIDLLNKDNKTGDEALASITASLAKEMAADAGNKAAEALHTLALDAANAKGQLETFQKNVENWYNDGMDRVSGWYKRYTQRVLLVIGFVIAASFNVSTGRVAQTMWFDKDTRQAMSNAANEYVKTHQPPPTPQNETGNTVDLVKELKGSADAFNEVTSATLLPVGWKHSAGEYLTMYQSDPLGGTWKGLKLLFGWLITACAISLGAPFWFDMLNKIMVVRSTIKPQEKSQPEKSKDK